MLPASAATVSETFEGEATGTFDGTADLTWLGDTGSWDINTAAWPTDHNFNGSRSLQGNENGTFTIATDISSVYSDSQTVDWSLFLSGTNKRDVWPNNPGGYHFSLVLMSDSSDAADIEAGNMNGYRLRIADDNTNTAQPWADTFYFEEANGAGWQTLETVETGANISYHEGWNLAVSRDSSGEFSWGWAQGDYGTAVTQDNTVTDTTTTGSTYSGMTLWGGGQSNYIGLDEFSVTSVPEPATPLMVIVMLAGSLGIRRRIR